MSSKQHESHIPPKQEHKLRLYDGILLYEINSIYERTSKGAIWSMIRFLLGFCGNIFSIIFINFFIFLNDSMLEDNQLRIQIKC